MQPQQDELMRKIGEFNEALVSLSNTVQTMITLLKLLGERGNNLIQEIAKLQQELDECKKKEGTPNDKPKGKT